MQLRIWLGLAVIGLVLAHRAPAEAQGRGRGDRESDGSGRDDERDRGGDRSGRDGERRRGGWSGGGNPEDFWNRFDRNGDGTIAPDEVDQRFRDRLGIDKPVKIEALVNRLRRGRDGQRDRENRTPATPQPAVPGFGVAADAKVTAPGFGPPGDAEANTAASSNSANRSAGGSNSSATNGGGGITSNAYVNGVLDKFDANKNGNLDGDEVRSSRVPASADANSDGKMTREELVAAFPAKNSSPAANQSNSDARRSYRFASAHERLPGSARSWIVSRDKNGDGQVAMHEFSRTWSESTVREFQRYDRDGDGVITADEYLAR